MDDTIVYCRISSSAQKYGVSLDAQLDQCLTNNPAASCIQEINSAFKGTPPILSDIVNNKKNTRVIFHAVDRFSRNVQRGISNLETMIKNKCVLIFIRENLTIDCLKGPAYDRFIELLKQAESESISIGNRVKTSLEYLIKNGFHSGGSVPYGYNLVKDNMFPGRKRLVKNNYESTVVKFITLACTKGTSISQLNKVLSKVAPIAKKDPIVVELNGKELTHLTSSISRYNIAWFLNAYGVKYRKGKNWSEGSVSLVYSKSQKKKRKSCPIEEGRKRKKHCK